MTKEKQIPDLVKTLKISDETHKELSKLGTLGETYEDVIKKLMKHWKKTHGISMESEN
jgi:predicted CopG family antitoxin